MKGCSRKSSDRVNKDGVADLLTALNERLLPKEQRRYRALPDDGGGGWPSMKGCSRKSSDTTNHDGGAPATSTLNERLLPKEQRRGFSVDEAMSAAKALNERLLPKEQRRAFDAFAQAERTALNERLLPKEQRHRGAHVGWWLQDPPSMKGCSRKSSDGKAEYIMASVKNPQ